MSFGTDIFKVSSLVCSLVTHIWYSNTVLLSPVWACVQFPGISDKTPATVRNSLTAWVNAESKVDGQETACVRQQSEERKPFWVFTESKAQPCQSIREQNSQAVGVTAKPAEQMGPFSIRCYIQFQRHY